MAVYHLKAGFGSRAGGQSAAAKRDYIEREGRYERDQDELEHRESGHMPAWAEEDPRAYWQAADAHERANGRLYSEIQFALPKELSAAERREAASHFAGQLTGPERLPYTLAIHRGGPDGANPHAHLMFSERGQDDIARSAEQWFTRYNAKAPEKGGARKSRAAKAGDWLATTRQTWAQTANLALEQAGREARIDHRSLADRRDAAARDGDLDRAAELSREPNIHLGPSRHRASDGAAAREKRRQARRVERATAAHAAERDTARRQVARMEREIAAVGARLQETYDRVRRALDARVQHAGRAIRAGAAAAQRAGRELRRASATLGRALRTGAERFRHVAGDYAPARRGPSEDGRARDAIDRRLRSAAQLVQRLDQRAQQARGGFDRIVSVIHAEAEQKRIRPDGLPDRVEGRIESLIQGAMRSREHDIGR